MAEQIALPLLLHNPPPSSRPFFQNHHQNQNPATPTPPPLPPPPPMPVTPLLQELLLHPNPSTPQTQNPTSPPTLPRARTRIGKSRDSNRGKPWSHHRLSSQGQHILHSFLDPQFDSSKLDEQLLGLVDLHRDEFGSSLDSLSLDVLGIVKGLGFHKKFDLAIDVFEWFKKREDCDSILSGSVVAVIISILGKVGRVSSATSLFQSLHKDGFALDVYAYTSLITACASNGRYREAVTVFKKMEEEGCMPTLITYNVILNVYGKMGMPWNKIRALVECMKSAGIAPDSYTYNTLITCCRRGSLHVEAAEVFQEMKSAGFVPDKVTYNALLDVYGKSRRTKEAMEVLKDMEFNGFSPSIVSYNSLISAYARDGLLEEATALKTQMVEKAHDHCIIVGTFPFLILPCGFLSVY